MINTFNYEAGIAETDKETTACTDKTMRQGAEGGESSQLSDRP